MQTTLTLENSRNLTRDALLVLLASFAICLSGKIAIPLWFTPIPLITQNTIVLLTGALLGARRGAAAVFLFLIQGAMGLPVFAKGQGLAYFAGPTGGYLIGYLIAAFLVGYLIEKQKSPIVAFAAANLTIYFFGAAYLATFVGIPKAFLLGVVPFLLGDILKTMAGLKLLQWINRKSNSC